MATPIAAGSVVIPRASDGAFIPESRRPKLGVCESATAPGGPGLPPTNVVVAWEDGTRDTFVAADGLLQFLAPTSPSLLGSVVRYNDAFTNGQVPHPGGRLDGPVVMQGTLALPNGDPFQAPASESVTIKSPLGFLVLPVAAVVAQPSA